MGIIEHVADRAARRPRRLARTLAAGACAAGLVLGISGCGFDAQTLQPYTPAQGVNTDVGSGPNQEPRVKVRGLLVVASEAGSGFLSAALIGTETDQLTGISGTVLSVTGETVGPLTVTLPEPFDVPADDALVLVDQPITTVEGEGMEPGLTVELTMTFAESGDVTLVVPVVDSDSAGYRTVSPAPATASPTASPDATPGG